MENLLDDCIGISENRLKHSYNVAKECYKIGCNCSICEIVPSWFKERCQMRGSVIELVRVLGKPFNREGAVIEDN